MQVLDRAGVGTLWSICKTKFALAGHTHSSVTDGTMTIYPMANNEVNFGGSNNSATIYFGYRAKDSKPIPTNFVFGGSTGTATLTAAKFKGALEGNASTASNASKVNGHTVNSDVPSGAKFTDTNTWRGIQDNLTSTSTSESLSANQGRVLKGLVDGKANSSDLSSYVQKGNAVNDVDFVIGASKVIELSVKKDNGETVYKKVPEAKSDRNGLMSVEDKAKLDKIESGANNYTLPAASNTTLGGIKAQMNIPVAGWPVCVNNDGFADTKIVGLAQNKQDTSIKSITVKQSIISSGHYTTYETDGIQINDNKKIVELDFPSKSGTFALTSDIPSIPDISNLCKFNFVSSISECVNGRINFLFKNSNDYVDLSFLNNLEEGTILLIYCPHVGFQITNTSTIWYYNGILKGADDTAYIEQAKLVLAFFYNTYVYVSNFSYN